MALCEASPLDLSQSCVRESWAAIAPAAFVLLFLLLSIPVPRSARKAVDVLKRPFTNFLPLEEALALDAGEVPSHIESEIPVPLWRSALLSVLSSGETVAWLGVATFNIVVLDGTAWDALRPFLFATTWLYASVRPMVRPTPTPPYDLFILYCVHLTSGTLMFGGALYDHGVSRVPLPSTVSIAAQVANPVVLVALLTLVLSMPLAIPGPRVNKDEIGKSVTPEDYTTLWGWITFHWVYPLIARGTYTTLNETDVWNLSPTMQARPLYMKFSATKRNTLLRTLWAANSLDIILDFTLTYVSVGFNYLGPYFLKRIIDLLGSPDRTQISAAYIYAFLAFLSTLCKAEADLQHLWFGRRVTTRVRSELMVAIYDKALKRKDLSGIVDKEKAKKKDAKADMSDPKADDPKAGADVGKIVNLMAGDSVRLSGVLSMIYMFYGAPFEVIIASVFLYQLLGWSAFAGFFVLIIGWPLNNFVAKRSVRIQKGLSTARDKRMGVLNELITAVKFIKFFAWEDRWIQRVLDAREAEMQWMIKYRVNYVCFSFIWSCAPVLVSLTSFLVYVMQGNQLTLGTAFTAIALFSMMRAPLNVIPAFIVQILQAGVAINRISTYLDEDEVDEQVSTLKRGKLSASDEIVEGLGIEHGTFKWNEVEERKDKAPAPVKAATTNGHGSEHTGTASGEDDSITVVDTASIAEEERRFELTDINVMFPEGQLTVITGPTASGKTALLMALLGEMTRLEGRLIMAKNSAKVDEYGLQHTISYAAQSPWLRHQSIKDNILFGYPLDEERYQDVVQCCALTPDLDMLEDGDATEIGARGVSLSGGQKARVALARAIYAPTKYVLLDDPLSAVDSHTARFLFEKLLCGPLVAHRTVLLVTHHVELVLPGTYYLIRMLDGRIDTQGTVKELQSRGVLDDITPGESADTYEKQRVAEIQVEKASEPLDEADNAKPAAKKKPRKLIEDERRETGNVKWSIYKTYLKASSYWTWIILIALIVTNQFLGVSEKFWIRIWGQAYEQGSNTTVLMLQSFLLPDPELSPINSYSAIHTEITPPYNTVSITQSTNWPPAQDHPFYYIGIYALISFGGVVVAIAGIITQYTGALRASRILFEKLLVGVVRATMRWHDVTPQGRMLNRFSKDVETVDTSLAGSLQQVNTSLALVAASVITVIAIFPWFIFPAILIGYVYRTLAIGYMNTGRDLRRMESNNRSPIFANFGEVLEGIVTVRAFSAEQRFLDHHNAGVDLATKMWYTVWMTNRWLLLHFDALGALFVLFTTLFALSGYVDAGLAAVCITSAMAFTMSVYWACRFWTALELDLNSVERVVEYLDLPQEPPAIIEANRPPAYWPSSSSSNSDALVSVENLVIRYAPELPPVLRGVTFHIKARERVGLLGRTGSGKSTLAMSMLRFVDPAEGRIMIDGIDISTIGITDLRSRITFIPQDATLFSGSLRDNLDPFGDHEDSECLDVLYRVHLLAEHRLTSQKTSREPSRPSSIHDVDHDETIASSTVSLTTTETDGRAPITLETQVSAGGTNFSQGQRQLIAMARALLRRSAIIILDEATSSIDFATDAKIQTTIREEFGDSLLLTVAHRLRTVIDYDKLIVLDKGELAEFDTPWNLINNEGGIFRDMCLKSGTFGELQAAVKAKMEADPSVV